MSISIKDIAKRARVSPSTVSRALKNHPRISQQRRAMIHRLASEMGYIPSEVARSLVAQRSATIGVTIADFADPFYADMIRGLEDAASAQGYQVLLSSHYKNPQRELEVVRSFHEKRLDGIVIPFSSLADVYQGRDSGFFIPIVMVNRPNYRMSVSTNRYRGAEMLMEYLISLGHRRIAYVEGLDSEGNAERLKAYYSVLQRNNILLDPSLIFPGSETLAGGFRAAQLIHQLQRLPTAIFAFNDLTAIGVMKGLSQLGHCVPKDISVAGYDDLDIAAHYQPALTTVKQPRYQLGKRAFELLLNVIHGKSIIQETLEPELIVRESATLPRNELGGNAWLEEV